MSLEAIKQVTQTEQDCAQRKLDAVQAAKRTVAEAERPARPRWTRAAGKLRRRFAP